MLISALSFHDLEPLLLFVEKAPLSQFWRISLPLLLFLVMFVLAEVDYRAKVVDDPCCWCPCGKPEEMLLCQLDCLWGAAPDWSLQFLLLNRASWLEHTAVKRMMSSQ